jgi:hypothetical protein
MTKTSAPHDHATHDATHDDAHAYLPHDVAPSPTHDERPHAYLPIPGDDAAREAADLASYERTTTEYALERIGDAVRLMAINDIPLRARVTGALAHISALMVGDVPEASRAIFRTLEARSTWATCKGDGTLAATLGVVSSGEVAQLAELICDLHASVVDALTTPLPEGPPLDDDRFYIEVPDDSP